MKKLIICLVLALLPGCAHDFGKLYFQAFYWPQAGLALAIASIPGDAGETKHGEIPVNYRPR